MNHTTDIAMWILYGIVAYLIIEMARCIKKSEAMMERIVCMAFVFALIVLMMAILESLRVAT